MKKGFYIPLDSWSVDLASEEVGEELRKENEYEWKDYYSQPLNETFAYIHQYATPDEKVGMLQMLKYLGKSE